MHFMLFTQSNRDGVFWAVKITLVYHIIHGFIFPNLMAKPSFEDVSKTFFSFVKRWTFLILKTVSSRYTARSQFLFHIRRQMWPLVSLGLELLSILTQSFWIFPLLSHERRILILVLRYYDKALFSLYFLVKLLKNILIFSWLYKVVENKGFLKICISYLYNKLNSSVETSCLRISHHFLASCNLLLAVWNSKSWNVSAMTVCLVSVGRIWVEHVASFKGLLFDLHAFSVSPRLSNRLQKLICEVELFIDPLLILIDFFSVM